MGIGIALSGGGLKGAAHIGVIQALEELGIEINSISGTSSGSIFAIMYAMGYTTNEMTEIFEECYKKVTKIKKMPIAKEAIHFIFTKNNSLTGLISGEEIEKVISHYANKKGLEKMKDIDKKVAIATVDAKTTKECILWSGEEEINEMGMDYISDISIGKAVRSSMAFPAVFTPCKYKNYIFIDGGTKDNLPVDVLEKMGEDKKIAVSFKLDTYRENSNLFDTILRACDIFSYRDVLNSQKKADCNIEISIEQAKLLSIDSISNSMKIGYDTVMKEKEKILELVREK